MESICTPPWRAQALELAGPSAGRAGGRATGVRGTGRRPPAAGSWGHSSGRAPAAGGWPFAPVGRPLPASRAPARSNPPARLRLPPATGRQAGPERTKGPPARRPADRGRQGPREDSIMAFLDDQTRTDIREVLGELPGPVALQALHPHRGLSDLRRPGWIARRARGHASSIQLEIIDMDRVPGLAVAFGVKQAPTLAVVGAEDHGVRFMGTPAGSSSRHCSTPSSRRHAAPRRWPRASAGAGGAHAAGGHQGVRDPTCPYCAPAVSTAHQIALASRRDRPHDRNPWSSPSWPRPTRCAACRPSS